MELNIRTQAPVLKDTELTIYLQEQQEENRYMFQQAATGITNNEENNASLSEQLTTLQAAYVALEARVTALEEAQNA